jgi:hypothetical protein
MGAAKSAARIKRERKPASYFAGANSKSTIGPKSAKPKTAKPKNNIQAAMKNAPNARRVLKKALR